MKKILIFSFILILSIGIVQASALSTLWKQGISATNPEAAKLISSADKIMEVQSLAQCATGLGAVACAEQIMTQKAMGQVYGEAMKIAGPEVQKVISTYQQLDLYKQAGAEIIGEVQINERGEIESGVIRFDSKKDHKAGHLVGKNLKDEDVLISGVDVEKRGDVTRLTFTDDEGGKVCIKENCFENIQSQSTAKHSTFLEVNQEGDIIKADFTTDENGGVYSFGNKDFEVPANSRVVYPDEANERPKIKCSEGSEIINVPHGEASYEGDFMIGGDKISGKVIVSNGKIIKVWKGTDATIKGINHETFGSSLNLYYEENFDASRHGEENYFNYGKDKISLGGKGFTSSIKEGNEMFPELILEKSIRGTPISERGIFEITPQGGFIEIEKDFTKKELSFNIKHEGDFELKNGGIAIFSEDNNIYTKSDSSMRISYDMNLNNEYEFDRFFFKNKNGYVEASLHPLFITSDRISKETFSNWYEKMLRERGFFSENFEEWNKKGFGDDALLAGYSEHAYTIWENREYIIDAGKKYGIDSDYLAATIMMEQIDLPDRPLSKVVGKVSPNLEKFVPKNIKVSEKVTDFLAGISRGASVGLGQVLTANLEVLPDQNMKGKSNFAKTIYLMNEKNNIYSLAELTSLHVQELKIKYPNIYKKGWGDKEFIDAMGSRQTSSKFIGAELWGTPIGAIKNVIKDMEVLDKNFLPQS